MGAERCLLLKRRYEGQLCPFTSTVRHSSQQHVQDTVCFGTNYINPNTDLTKIPGFDPTSATSVVLPDGLGGYYHSIEITASLLTTGPLPINAKESGWKRDQLPRSCWTLWEPILETGDIIVRRNNQRYVVTDPDPKRFRHFVTHQTFNLVELEKNHPIFSLPLEGI